MCALGNNEPVLVGHVFVFLSYGTSAPPYELGFLEIKVNSRVAFLLAVVRREKKKSLECLRFSEREVVIGDLSEPIDGPTFQE